MYRQSEKNLLNTDISSTCLHNMVNVGLLSTSEICWRVWGTPANFNGSRVLATLLHGTLVVGVSQTLRRWTEGRATITLGIGPHSGCTYNVHWRCCSCVIVVTLSVLLLFYYPVLNWKERLISDDSVYVNTRESCWTECFVRTASDDDLTASLSTVVLSRIKIFKWYE